MQAVQGSLLVFLICYTSLFFPKFPLQICIILIIRRDKRLKDEKPKMLETKCHVFNLGWILRPLLLTDMSQLSIPPLPSTFTTTLQTQWQTLPWRPTHIHQLCHSCSQLENSSKFSLPSESSSSLKVWMKQWALSNCHCPTKTPSNLSFSPEFVALLESSSHLCFHQLYTSLLS